MKHEANIIIVANANTIISSSIGTITTLYKSKTAFAGNC